MTATIVSANLSLIGENSKSRRSDHDGIVSEGLVKRFGNVTADGQVKPCNAKRDEQDMVFRLLHDLAQTFTPKYE